MCPGQPDLAAMAEMMADGEPCDGMDETQPVLCHQYASGAAQTFEAIKLITPSQPALVQVLILPPVPLVEVTALAPITARPEPRPPPDPLFLATLRLRV